MTVPNVVALQECLERTYRHVESDEYEFLSGPDANGKWRDTPLVPEQWDHSSQLILPGISESNLTDLYFSQNSFYRPQRRNSTVRRLNALYVDLDSYKIGLDPTMALSHALEILEASNIPAPTEWRSSGRGIYLIWLLNGQRAWPEFHAVWDACQAELIEWLKPLGADAGAKDAARVLRPDGTTNSKVPGFVVYSKPISEEEYTLETMANALGVPWPKKGKRKRQRIGRRPVAKPFSTATGAFSLRTLGYARMRDLETLNSLRGGFRQGLRNRVLFCYAASARLVGWDEYLVQQEIMAVNSEFILPLPISEVKSVVKSSSKGYKFYTATIIDWLGISSDEQQQLSVTISTKEKYRRERSARNETTYTVLDAYNRMPGARQIDIAEAIYKSQPTVSKALASLGLCTSNLYKDERGTRRGLGRKPACL